MEPADSVPPLRQRRHSQHGDDISTSTRLWHGMEHMIDRDAELEAFFAEIESTGWRAQILDLPHSAAVCLRLERHVEGVEEPVDVFEICRRSVARAVESARKRVFS